MLSVQRVLHDCQEKGVVKDIKKLINHPKLKSHTQDKLKLMYRANENVEMEQPEPQNLLDQPDGIYDISMGDG